VACTKGFTMSKEKGVKKEEASKKEQPKKRSHMWVIWLLVFGALVFIAPGIFDFFQQNELVEQENEIINEMDSVAQQMDLEVTRINSALELQNIDTVKNSLTEYAVLLERYDQLAQEYVDLANADGILDEQEKENIESFKDSEKHALKNIQNVRNSIEYIEGANAAKDILSSLLLGLI